MERNRILCRAAPRSGTDISRLRQKCVESLRKERRRLKESVPDEQVTSPASSEFRWPTIVARGSRELSSIKPSSDGLPLHAFQRRGPLYTLFVCQAPGTGSVLADR